MRRITGMVIAAVTAFALSSPASAQVISLLVGNESGFAGLDSNAAANGAYQGVFASVGSGTQLSYFKYGGPNNNLFVQQGNNVLQFNGHTGNFINTFINQTGGQFAFGADNNLYRLEPFSQTQFYPAGIGKYDGSTGTRIGTFVSPSVSGINSASGGMRFGPDGNLYVDNANSILRYNGTTGTPLGAFVAPGSGGLTVAFDALFASNGDLIVSGGDGSANGGVLRFNGSTGAFIGPFATGNGINDPIGLAQGPDGRIYVASSFSNEIKRFDLLTGAFVDNFVPVTAHNSPSYLEFTPFPIPEPSSLTLGAVALAGLVLARARNHGALARSSSARIF